MCREWVSGPWPTWVKSISKLARGVAGARQSGVLLRAQKNVTCGGGDSAAGRNASKRGMQAGERVL